MTDLTPRIEDATEAEQRELLLEVWEVLNPVSMCRDADEGEAHTIKEYAFLAMLAAHAHLSAAESMVPEGWEWTVGRTYDDKGKANLWEMEGWRVIDIEASTPALALASAILKTLEPKQP